MSQKLYLKLVIGVALIAVTALSVLVWRDDARESEPIVEQPSAPLTEPEKMNVLLQLSASATTSATASEKQEILDGLHDSNPDASGPSKADVMRSLRRKLTVRRQLSGPSIELTRLGYPHTRRSPPN